MRGFVRRAAREMRGSRTVGDKGQPVYAGQGCQSAGGYNKGPGVERPRGQGLCI